jgi:TPR repeat protein
MLLRFGIALVLSIVCLTSSACADIKPSVDTAEIDRAEDETTVKEFRKLAEEGSVTAQNGLGLLYKVGAGVPQNYVQAKKWFEEAAQQGHAEAQVNLGTLYLEGAGAPQSDQMALFWFSQAAEQGDVPAFAKLGLMYAQARGVPQDFIQAHMWFHLAAANGDEYSAERRDLLAMNMTTTQITEAQKRTREWKPTSKSVAWKLRTLSDTLLEARREIITEASPH